MQNAKPDADGLSKTFSVNMFCSSSCLILRKSFSELMTFEERWPEMIWFSEDVFHVFYGLLVRPNLAEPTEIVVITTVAPF